MVSMKNPDNHLGKLSAQISPGVFVAFSPPNTYILYEVASGAAPATAHICHLEFGIPGPY